MRVIAGRFRSRKLAAPRGLKVRPTSDRLRETLFNVLATAKGPVLEGSVWLDLYAGTGAVGIEALSRGAALVHFVESARQPAECIRANLGALDVREGFEVQEREVLPALRRLDAQGVICDYVFLDPPYRDAEAYAQALGFLAGSRLLGPASVVIAEHDRHFDPGDAVGRLRRFRRLEQGDAVLSFYRIEPV
ncbi:MAG TPA: 16S rRNA (guanine(966)-N(2))-methyltransferase RsmD [Terriglobales bacterium]|nr:16S rRNA (guanine(966)-N(2))-methyltransferase RsmD [Terriglobales bacterium]